MSERNKRPHQRRAVRGRSAGDVRVPLDISAVEAAVRRINSLMHAVLHGHHGGAGVTSYSAHLLGEFVAPPLGTATVPMLVV